MASTRAQLRTNAQTRADQDSSDFPTQSQFNVWLDQAARFVQYDLVKAGWPQAYKSLTLNGNGATIYNLTTALGGDDILGVHGVYYLQGTDYYPLHRINEGKRAILRSSTYLPAGFSGYYDIMVDPSTGYNLELLPKSLNGSLYQVDYLVAFPGFSSDSATWFGPARSDELIEIRAAYNAVRKEGQAREPEAQVLKAEYAEVLASVQDMASYLHLRDPAMIRDVQSEAGRFSFDFPVAGPSPGNGW